MGRTESLNLRNDYERVCGWYGHFYESEMALFSECTDSYAQKLLDTADICQRRDVTPVETNSVIYSVADRSWTARPSESCLRLTAHSFAIAFSVLFGGMCLYTWVPLVDLRVRRPLLMA